MFYVFDLDLEQYVVLLHDIVMFVGSEEECKKFIQMRSIL